MRKLGICFVLLATLAMVSCGPPEPGTPVTFDTACDLANDGKRVSLEGYPQLPTFLMVGDDFRADFYPEPGAQGESIGVYFTVGTGANQAEDIPEDFTDADLKIHTKDNAIVSVDDHIRVHGKMSVAGEGDTFVCFLDDVDLIEPVE
jgi:hypothetical protein